MGITPEIDIAARTDVGRLRTQNEDAVAVNAELGYAILADGMGGYRAGEVASLLAVSTLESAFRAELGRLPQAHAKEADRQHEVSTLILSAIDVANAEIIRMSRTDPECEGMGTTVVAAVVEGNTITIAHVGDSRAYRMRGGVLGQITKDHSLLQEQIDAGLISAEEARGSVNRNLVTRAVGIDSGMQAEIHAHAIEAGDVYLFCSDGLCDMVDDAGIRDILLGQSTSLDDACAALVNKANELGGHDNISVILLRIGERALEPPTLFERVRNWLG